jgi:hypothetical protein
MTKQKCRNDAITTGRRNDATNEQLQSQQDLPMQMLTNATTKSGTIAPMDPILFGPGHIGDKSKTTKVAH